MAEPELPEPTPEERELSRKLAELAGLEEILAGRELARSSLEVELHVFEVHYLATVGKRYAELDALEAEIAELEAERHPDDLEAWERAEAARARAQESADAVEARPLRLGRRTGPVPESLKRLFRKVARVIHPDLAEDDWTRARRQELMSAANEAYATGNELRLAAILKEWEESPETVEGHNPAAELLRVIRHIARVRDRLDTVERELKELAESALATLRRRVEAAEREGRDLLEEMAEALGPQVEAAAARLQRLRQTGGAR